MTRVEVASFVRMSDGSFLDVSQVSGFTGDCSYVPGAISLVVDGAELFGLHLWDDVNWLWPSVIQVLGECRQTGSGLRAFPGQPVSFAAESAWSGHTLLRLTDGSTIDRSAVAPDDDLFEAVAVAGLTFFDAMRQLCPGSDLPQEERTVLSTWLTSQR